MSLRKTRAHSRPARRTDLFCATSIGSNLNADGAGDGREAPKTALKASTKSKKKTRMARSIEEWGQIEPATTDDAFIAHQLGGCVISERDRNGSID
uniref:Uncharacterized protein n=1 Tax=Plectus sambesii TaxID=2011161 RepID=A0A914XLQ5_9BILA